MGVAAAAAVVLMISRGEPASSTRYEVEADLDGKRTPFRNDILTSCFGSSHAATALRASWQSELAAVSKDLGTKFVRFHGLLDDDMSVVIAGSGSKASAHTRVRTEFTSKKQGERLCHFQKGIDYHDPAGPVLNATSAQDCCEKCYNTPTGLPDPCIVAVYVDSKCYTKLNSAVPINNSAAVSCVTSRRPPRGFRYSWTNIFKVFDFILSINVRPVVELSFMPSLLASDPSQVVFWYRGGKSMPANWDDWRDFMGALANALVERYGVDEVKQWYFEVWNEPNCGFFATTPCCGPACGNHTAYLDLFENTYRAIKGVQPDLRVGGPATAQLGWLDSFLKEASSRGVYPDFTTSHLYPTDPNVAPTREGFSEAIENAASTVASTANGLGRPTPQLLITEFNCGLGLHCADSPYAASFVAHHARMAQRTANVIPFQSYWTFSDIFEEQGQQPSEFSQAFGTRTVNGIPKPVYRALQLIRQLHPSSVPIIPHDSLVNSNNANASQIDVTVTVNDSAIAALVTNHPGGPLHLPPNGSTTLVNSAVSVTITFTGGKPPVDNYVMLQRVDWNHSNAVETWLKLGSPEYPSADTLRRLVTASEITSEPLTISRLPSGKWSVELDMPAYSVAMVSTA